MKEKMDTPKKTRGCLSVFLIIIGSLAGLFVTLGILVFIFSGSSNDNGNNGKLHTKNSVYAVASDPLFSEKLVLKGDYDNEDILIKYTNLLDHLVGTYSIRTRDYDFSLRKGMKEMHVIPVKNNKTNSENRKMYSIQFGVPIAGHLAFGIKDQYGKKGLIDFQFDSKTNPERIVVVKYLVENEDYCQRGVVYDIAEHRGNMF